MRIVVIGDAAAAYAAMVGQDERAEVTVIADPSVEWASALAAATDGGQIVVTDLASGEDDRWSQLADTAGDRLILSRRLRFDRIFSTAKQAIRTGDVGILRTVHIAWSFAPRAGGPDALNQVALATELADVALWLLDDAPRTVYALAGAVDGPPLVTVNLQTQSGLLAVLEATVISAGLPPFRDVSLLGSAGAIYHRTLNDDLLWTTSGAEVLSYSDHTLDVETAAVMSDPPDREGFLARGGAVTRNLAMARALARSLANGQPVRVGEEPD